MQLCQAYRVPFELLSVLIVTLKDIDLLLLLI